MVTLLYPDPFVAGQTLLDTLGAETIDAETMARDYAEMEANERRAIEAVAVREYVARHVLPRVERLAELTSMGFDGTAWLEADTWASELRSGIA